MAKTTGTAREFILGILSTNPDRELRVADIYREASGRFQKNNLQESLGRLLSAGLVVKSIDPDRSAWWAIRNPPAGQ